MFDMPQVNLLPISNSSIILSHGTWSTCFNPSETLCFSLSSAKIFTFTLSAIARCCEGCFIFFHEISVICNIKKENVQLTIEDEGPGFNQKNIDKVFNRFYSNRPEKFGEHSGLGLNIVKNIIELHGGSVIASNQTGNKKGARIEVLLPIYK